MLVRQLLQKGSKQSCIFSIVPCHPLIDKQALKLFSCRCQVVELSRLLKIKRSILRSKCHLADEIEQPFVFLPCLRQVSARSRQRSIPGLGVHVVECLVWRSCPVSIGRPEAKASIIEYVVNARSTTKALHYITSGLVPSVC